MARGHIRKRYLKRPINGVNFTYAIVYPLNGKPKWETVGPNKKEAQRLLTQRLSEVNNGTYHKPSEITFQDLASKWLATKEMRVKPSTFRGYKGDLSCHLLPVLGDMPISRITRDKIEQLLINIRKKRAADTVNNIRLLALMIFSYAKSLKYILENPVEEVKRYPLDHKEMDYLAPEEIGKFLKHASEPFKTLFLTAILTGMRRGEILGLQWGDVDWNSNTIFVRRSLYWLTKKENQENGHRWKFIEPKSKRSKRAIVMSPKLKEALEMHCMLTVNSSCDLIFCNKDGNPLDPDNMVKREFIPTLRFAGLRQVRFHDLRHTYATLLITQGTNFKFIQNQLGHSSIQTTIDRYGHLLPSEQYGVGPKLDAQIFSKSLPKPDLEVDNLKVNAPQHNPQLATT